MNTVGLLYELTKATGFDNMDRKELIELLWKDYITYQDWGYGNNQRIKELLMKNAEMFISIIESEC